MSKEFTFRYVFHLDSGEQRTYEIILDEHLRLANPPDAASLPAWVGLDEKKCPGCTLDSTQEEYCPAAVGISGLLNQFKDLNSTRKARVEVQTAERTYVKDTDLQEGLFSIMGIIMPASGCPALKFLRPMARFHLPFSTIDETEVRAVSLFFLSKYFDDGPQRDFDDYLDELGAKYKMLQTVNDCLIERIRLMEKTGDVNKNAVVILKVLSQALTMEIGSRLQGIRHLFSG